MTSVMVMKCERDGNEMVMKIPPKTQQKNRERTTNDQQKSYKGLAQRTQTTRRRPHKAHQKCGKVAYTLVYVIFFLYLCARFRMKSESMKHFLTLILSLFTAMTVCADTSVRLSYQGFPYKRTACAYPVYAAGSVVTLSAAQPQNSEGQIVIGWTYNGVTYLPGAQFTMPETDVELVPVWENPEQGIEQSGRQDATAERSKILREGRLYIFHGENEYDVQGARVK